MLSVASDPLFLTVQLLVAEFALSAQILSDLLVS